MCIRSDKFTAIIFNKLNVIKFYLLNRNYPCIPIKIVQCDHIPSRMLYLSNDNLIIVFDATNTIHCMSKSYEILWIKVIDKWRGHKYVVKDANDNLYLHNGLMDMIVLSPVDEIIKQHHIAYYSCNIIVPIDDFFITNSQDGKKVYLFSNDGEFVCDAPLDNLRSEFLKLQRV
jgi:hypothetical protein